MARWSEVVVMMCLNKLLWLSCRRIFQKICNSLGRWFFQLACWGDSLPTDLLGKEIKLPFLWLSDQSLYSARRNLWTCFMYACLPWLFMHEMKCMINVYDYMKWLYAIGSRVSTWVYMNTGFYLGYIGWLDFEWMPIMIGLWGCANNHWTLKVCQ
jgi:hypothetical protein